MTSNKTSDKAKGKRKSQDSSEPTDDNIKKPKENSADRKYTFFFGKDEVFSQFHSANFTVDGIEYNCMEQYMHHQKAVTFKDDIRATLIMEAVEPLKHKRLGREVKNFDKTVWGRKSIEVVKKGNLEKYRQNPAMKKVLFDTYPSTLVEASPRDRLWGIGLGRNNPKALNKESWRGKNLLGFALTDVRNTLIKEEEGKV